MTKGVVVLISLVWFSVGADAQNMEWKWVQQLRPSTLIAVQTRQGKTQCRFELVVDDRLFCSTASPTTAKAASDSELVFHRGDIRSVVVVMDYDYSKGYLSLLAAAGGGAAVESRNQPDWFAGFKIGGPFSVDLQYDVVRGHGGFAIEGEPVIPLFRFPRFKADEDNNFIKLFGEPGLGYRTGVGSFNGYASAKVLVLLTKRWDKGTPYIEVQRRFPFDSPLDGDTRIGIGMMFALCEHCGVD